MKDPNTIKTDKNNNNNNYYLATINSTVYEYGPLFGISRREF